MPLLEWVLIDEIRIVNLPLSGLLNCKIILNFHWFYILRTLNLTML